VGQVDQLDELEELLQEFLVESAESLDQLEADLIDAERAPASAHLLDGVFRAFHTMKGTSGYLGLERLEGLAHVGEGLLVVLRDGRLPLTAARTDGLLELVDAVRAVLHTLETTGGEGETDHGALVARVEALAVVAPVAEAPGSAGASGGSRPDGATVGEILVRAGLVTQDDIARARVVQDAGDTRRMGEILVALGVVTDRDVSDALEQQHETRRSVTDGTVRLDVDLLDELAGGVGELALVRDQVRAAAAVLGDAALLRAARRLEGVTDRLQQAARRTRLQAVETVWSKLPRVVREISQQCGREVDLRLEGVDVEFDRLFLEAVRDPLTHLVRNAVDHGIEPAEQRLAAGKPARGTVVLRARRDGDRAVVEVIDDGAGIDDVRIGRTALERGLVSAEQLAAMAPAEVRGLIFRPGFSTADAVTRVSGRGVGMDVVKTNLQRVGGTVEVESVPGRGSTVRLAAPLTRAAERPAARATATAGAA
jgi:two-component system, chemotaxis family, sensor kinase CheA